MGKISSSFTRTSIKIQHEGFTTSIGFNECEKKCHAWSFPVLLLFIILVDLLSLKCGCVVSALMV